jgi:hypothetical protein
MKTIFKTIQNQKMFSSFAGEVSGDYRPDECRFLVARVEEGKPVEFWPRASVPAGAVPASVGRKLENHRRQAWRARLFRVGHPNPTPWAYHADGKFTGKTARDRANLGCQVRLARTAPPRLP